MSEFSGSKNVYIIYISKNPHKIAKLSLTVREWGVKVLAEISAKNFFTCSLSIRDKGFKEFYTPPPNNFDYNFCLFFKKAIKISIAIPVTHVPVINP